MPGASKGPWSRAIRLYPTSSAATQPEKPWQQLARLVPRSLTLLKSFGITGARWSPDGAEVILKIRAVVVNRELNDYMN